MDSKPYYSSFSIKTEVVSNLWLGDLNDGANWGGGGQPAIYVHEAPWEEKPMSTMWMPFLREMRSDEKVVRPRQQKEEDLALLIMGNYAADTEVLDDIANKIDYHLKAKRPILVHCQGGIERSPLATVWYLHRKMGHSIDAAYSLVRSKRAIISRRDVWLRNGGYEYL